MASRYVWGVDVVGSIPTGETKFCIKDQLVHSEMVDATGFDPVVLRSLRGGPAKQMLRELVFKLDSYPDLRRIVTVRSDQRIAMRMRFKLGS